MPKRKMLKSKKKTMKKKRPARTQKKIAMKKKVKVKAKKTSKKVMKKAAKKVTSKMIGRVTHYYDRIGVAIVELAQPLHLGDVVMMKRGEVEMMQPVQSLQIEHQPVAVAKKGDVVGMKVDQEVREGTMVMPM